MTNPLKDAGSVWLVGCGNMGGAMLRGWLANGLSASAVTVIDPFTADVPDGVRLLKDVPAGEAPPATLLLAVKPQSLDMVAPVLAPAVGAGTMVVSILAGVEIATLKARLNAAVVVRAMPNTPAAIGRGVTALFGEGVDAAQRARAEAMMAALGTVAWIDREDQFDAVTALSGCGPGFVFRFIDALAEAGSALGLPPELAARLALETVAGSAALAEASSETPAQLADRVASPGGATREGLNRLDESNGIRALMQETLSAAAKRSAELAAAARKGG